MTKEQLQNIKDKVLIEIKQTKTDINILDEHSKPLEIGCCLDHIARSDLQVDIENGVKRMGELEVKLKLLLATLDKIDEDDYGECVMCGDDINIKRLQALAWATQCIECASLN